jgi:site-specific recombinase XerD
MDDYKMPVMQQRTPHPLPGLNEDLTKLLHECDSNNKRALIALLGLEGMRLHEALDLPLDRIDMKAMTIEVWGKGNKVRILPITERAFQFIAPAYIDAMMASRANLIVYSDRGARLFITELGRRCRLLREISSHDLRATFATLAYAARKDINLVRYWMGHESVETTQTYIGISMEDVRSVGSF